MEASLLALRLIEQVASLTPVVRLERKDPTSFGVGMWAAASSVEVMRMAGLWLANPLHERYRMTSRSKPVQVDRPPASLLQVEASESPERPFDV
jgi:hypothetical protein